MGKASDVTIRPEEYFRLNNGRVLKNLYELMNSLESMDDDVFGFHVNESRNDFGNWVRDIFKDEALSKSIFESKTREALIKAIESRLFEEKKYPKSVPEIRNDKPKLKQAAEPDRKLIRAYPFSRVPPKKISQKPIQQDIAKPLDDSSSNRIDEILAREKEIEKREEKIEEIEARIENELAGLSSKKQNKFFSREFMEGLLIGLVLALVIGMAYIKFLS